LPEQRRTQLKADDEKHHDHAEFGEMHDVAAAIDKAQGIRPDDRARQQVPDDRAEPEPFRKGHRDDGGQQVDECLIEAAAHFVFWVER
jgi:hypothetical protein